MALARRRLRQHLFHDLRFDDDGVRASRFRAQPAGLRGRAASWSPTAISAAARRARTAVWALADYGIRAVIAPSFGDIFFNNSFKNGLLPIVLPEERVAELRASLERRQDVRIEIDLQNQTVTGPGGTVDHFEVDPLRKQLLLEGMDDITFTMQHADAIAAFDSTYDRAVPWLAK